MRGIVHTLALILAGQLAQAVEIEDRAEFGDPEAGRVLSVLSTTDAVVFSPLVEAFLAGRPDLRVTYTVASSQDVYDAVLSREGGFDLVISSAMDLQMKLANDGFASAHVSPATQALPQWARWRDHLFAIAQEPVVVIVSTRGLAGLPEPHTRSDLVNLLRDNPGRFSGKVGTYDPAVSGSGYLFATQDARQSDSYWRLAEVMGTLSPRLYGTSGAMISDIQTGRLILAYNVLGSYAQALLEPGGDGRVIELEDFTHVLLRTALIDRDGDEPELAGEFLDYLLSDEGQTLIETRAGLPRINEQALRAGPHLRPIRLDPGLLVYVDPLKRQRFLNEWAAAVTRR